MVKAQERQLRGVMHEKDSDGYDCINGKLLASQTMVDAPISALPIIE